jgi:hypothetical protein
MFFLKHLKADSLFQPALICNFLLYSNLKLLNFCSQKLDSEIVADMKSSVQLLYLCEFPESVRWQLLYRASRDGFAAQIFHANCDHKPGTLVIIKSTMGNVFCGYTQQAWESTIVNKLDDKAFLFSFTNKREPFCHLFSGQVWHYIWLWL